MRQKGKENACWRLLCCLCRTIAEAEKGERSPPPPLKSRPIPSRLSSRPAQQPTKEPTHSVPGSSFDHGGLPSMFGPSSIQSPEDDIRPFEPSGPGSSFDYGGGLPSMFGPSGTQQPEEDVRPFEPLNSRQPARPPEYGLALPEAVPSEDRPEMEMHNVGPNCSGPLVSPESRLAEAAWSHEGPDVGMHNGGPCCSGKLIPLSGPP